MNSLKTVLFLALVFATQGTAHCEFVYTLDMAKADAAKSLVYVDKGKFDRALIVPLERFPEKYPKALKAQKSGENLASQLTKANLATTSHWLGPQKNRKLVEARRIDFPLFSNTPTYRVIFEADSPRGKIREDVILSVTAPAGKNKGHFTYAYHFKVK